MPWSMYPVHWKYEVFDDLYLGVVLCPYHFFR